MLLTTPSMVDAAVEGMRRHWRARSLIILAEEVSFGTAALISEARGLGAEVLGVVAGRDLRTQHTGEPVSECPVHWVAALSADCTRQAFAERVADPSPTLRDWLMRIDPQGKAAVLAGNRTEDAEVCGRPVFGRRRRSWAAWEDKTRIDDLWRRLQVPAPPSEIVPLDPESLRSAAAAVDNGLGVVLAMDSTTGFRGDSHGLAWVRDPAELAAIEENWRGFTRTVRVSPFLAGVPYSVLGLVTPKGVAVFDPIEIVTLRRGEGLGFVFCGSSTRWRPAADTAHAIMSQARVAGDELRGGYGYRGFFSVDGIATATGCFPTELNPRHASGLGLRAAWPAFPAYMFNRCLQEGLDLFDDFAPGPFEEWVRASVAEYPSLSVAVPLENRREPATGADELCTSEGEHTVEWDSAGDRLTVRDLRGAPGTEGRPIGPVIARLAQRHGCALLSHDTPPPELADVWEEGCR
ncbi:hypothetical protein ACFRQM_31935 [Streptomyces sp. NPDC056831]|uniref:hypothetical protein n=1 Tax=Streptomyces sp. NPDC056831 TaxID=3345954 RepID=UPI0036A48B6D